LAAYGFNVSNRMGDVFIAKRSVDSASRAKVVFGAIFHPNPLALDNAALRVLNESRNLIVHRRAIVDATYIDNIRGLLPPGVQPPPLCQELLVRPEDLISAFQTVVDAGTKLIAACDGLLRQTDRSGEPAGLSA